MPTRRSLLSTMILLLLTIFVGVCRPALSLEPAEIYERWGAAVVTVIGQDQLGSGFMIPPTGYIVTNYHVIQNQPSLSIQFQDGTRHEVSRLVAQDPYRDLAVLAVDAARLPMVVLGDSDAVRVGEHVVAIGSPFGLSETVTTGIISQVRHLEDVTLLQTTAPLSPGNSGGPLFNERGEVIGVNKLAGNPQVRVQNINFSIAIRELEKTLGVPLSVQPRQAQPPAGTAAVPTAPAPSSEPSESPSSWGLLLILAVAVSLGLVGWRGLRRPNPVTSGEPVSGFPGRELEVGSPSAVSSAFCPECGQPIAGGSQLCPYCGGTVN